MNRLMLLLAMLAVVVMVAATPVMAQNDKAAAKAAKAEAKAAKQSDKMKEMPKTGGIPINASVLGLGTGVLLVGGGLLVRKVTR